MKGMRVLCIMHWKGKVPAVRVMKSPPQLLLPIAGLSGAALPNDRTIDGKDIGPYRWQERRANSS